MCKTWPAGHLNHGVLQAQKGIINKINILVKLEANKLKECLLLVSFIFNTGCCLHLDWTHTHIQ